MATYTTADPPFDPAKTVLLARLRGEDYSVRLVNLDVDFETHYSTVTVRVDATQDQLSGVTDVARNSPLVLNTGPTTAIILWDITSFSIGDASILSTTHLTLEIRARGYCISGDFS